MSCGRQHSNLRLQGGQALGPVVAGLGTAPPGAEVADRPRCEYCGAFVSPRSPQCNNPRCPGAKLDQADLEQVKEIVRTLPPGVQLQVVDVPTDDGHQHVLVAVDSTKVEPGDEQTVVAAVQEALQKQGEGVAPKDLPCQVLAELTH